MIKQAIIPLAGLGTRLLPLTSVFAKELLPINGKPGIEYILDECVQAGIREIIFIISDKKKIVKNINQKKKELSQKYKVKIEYLELRNKMNLVKSNNINNSNLFFAYYVNNIRLIDNV